MNFPFLGKDNSEENLRKETQAFDKQQNVLGNTIHPGNQDEAVFLEQKEQRADLIKWQQNLAPEIQQLVHRIKRERQITPELWEAYSDIEPLANNKFIMDTIGLIELSMNKNLINSAYTDEKVRTALKSTVFDFRCMLQANREEYNIDKTNMYLIVRLFKNAIEPSYWRCWNNGERKYTSVLSKRVEVHTDQPEKKGGNSLFGMGG